jgi:rSAM/selenodomain-associated transferase 2/rSAM/selenodomain-associated transferase 1
MTKPMTHSALDRGSRPRGRLIVFTRWPEPGKAKTRLIPALGEEGAAKLQREMTEHTLALARRFASDGIADLEVRYEGGDRERMRGWLGSRHALRPQGGGDLGERMARAARSAFDSGSTAAVVVGTDCPDLSPDVLGGAFAGLDRADVVVGPATDGGYYLIGMAASAAAKSIPCIFEGIPWGSGEVLSRTLLRAEVAGVTLEQLRQLPDVDRPEDLVHWERVRRGMGSREYAQRVSVIVPALNEAANIGKTVASAKAGENVEVIVVDGRSEDATVAVAHAAGARVVSSRRGRGAQMNAGAAIAEGKILLFLHADTLLPERFDSHVRGALSSSGVIAGAFEFGVDLEGKRYRRIERMVNWRSRVLSMPYGDQALFVKTCDFRRLGGFRNMPILEDVDLVRRLHHWGRIVTVPAKVVTSGRRWRELGPWRATILNRLAAYAFALGFQPSQITGWYRPIVAGSRDSC